MVFSYFQILRPGNAVMAAIGVALGSWIGNAQHRIGDLLLLCTAAFAATGFGNIVNDVFDIATDRISHPTRPLACGAMSLQQAWLFAFTLLVASLFCGFAVSPAHGFGTVTPLILLFAYARHLKKTPLLGNCLVSLLVAYPIIYGALTAAGVVRLYTPAALAFLANLCREIVKDLQDREGDAAAGMVTTAVLPRRTIQTILATATVASFVILWIPFALGHFHTAYLIVCLFAVVPLRLLWGSRFFASPGDMATLRKVSVLIKAEMLAGLAALAIDQIFTLTMQYS